MKHLLLASLITLLAFGTACGQASEPEPVASDGIQVHGHWTVTVTNPDGTLDAVHEFDNKLGKYAPDLLTALIVGETTVDNWRIWLSQDAENGGMFSIVPEALWCQEAGDKTVAATDDAVYISATATRNTEIAKSPLMITGVCTVTTTEPSVDIRKVATMIRLASHIDEHVSKLFRFTEYVVTPITVVNDQSLSFNIVISFS